MITVEFLRPFRMRGGARFNVGEQAGLTDDDAADAVRQGVARIVTRPSRTMTAGISTPPADKMLHGPEVKKGR